MEKDNLIKEKLASDVPGVDILVLNDGRVALVSKKDRVLVKGSHLGGFGAGTYVELVDLSVAGVHFAMPDGDQTLVEVDHASFADVLKGNDGKVAGFSCSTLYQLLRKMERNGVVQHKVAFCEVERVPDAGRDSFTIKVTKPMLYKFVGDDTPAPAASAKKKQRKKKEPVEKASTSKNVFRNIAKNMFDNKLAVCFRFRFESVGKCMKVQKPYCVLKHAVDLSGGKPQVV